MKIQQQNAMIYCRADFNENTSEIIHLLNQENEIQKCCKDLGFKVVKKFTDYTTTLNKSQPEFHNMKDFAMQSENRIHLLVCFELAQIARTFEKVLDEIIDFNQMGINVTSVQQLINYKNNTNER
jgi:DNA invertase Pin-like site-specific DNA recombinase